LFEEMKPPRGRGREPLILSKRMLRVGKHTKKTNTNATKGQTA